MLAPWEEPFTRFGVVFEEAKRAQPKDPNAMSVATVDARGRPSVRVCLLKGFDVQGFVFFTNHRSHKGRDLLGQQVAALNFHWPALEQQVRIEGGVAQVSAQEADEYFASRPRESQLGAWASEQSAPLSSREALEARLEAITTQYANSVVPRPPHWGGFRVSPERIEFWKAHPYRLHWREAYVRAGDGWEKSLLNP